MVAILEYSKKILSAMLCLSMLFTLSVASFAAEITNSGGTKQTNAIKLRTFGIE